MPDSPLLQLKGIDKSFPGCRANEAIDLDIQAGEIHALLGENGAGKSTLVKIIYGVLRPDHGDLWWQGKPLRVASPAAARRVGIGMVFQHFSLFEAMTVLENIALALPAQDVGALRDNIDATAESYGLALDLDRDVYELSMGERQRIEIIKLTLLGADIMILDEPTAVLTDDESLTVLSLLQDMADQGRAVVLITHRLREVTQYADRVTVMRAGQTVLAGKNVYPDQSFTDLFAQAQNNVTTLVDTMSTPEAQAAINANIQQAKTFSDGAIRTGLDGVKELMQQSDLKSLLENDATNMLNEETTDYVQI